jgi:hypothetical protein
MQAAGRRYFSTKSAPRESEEYPKNRVQSVGSKKQVTLEA